MEGSSLEKEISPDILQSFPVLFLSKKNFDFGPENIPQVITVDIEEGADIQGDAWDPDTILKIKSHDKNKGQFSAIFLKD